MAIFPPESATQSGQKPNLPHPDRPFWPVLTPVPHIRIEEELEKLVGPDEEGKLRIAVTAVPDDKKGERLVVLHTPLEKSADELRKGLAAAGLPNLFLPDAQCFVEVLELPVLGSGKPDLRGIKSLAVEKMRRS